MNYILRHAGKIVLVTQESPYTGTGVLKSELGGVKFDSVEDSCDFKSFDQTKQIAEEVSALTGKQWLACERDGCSPRFTIIQAPQIGDKVSSGFNGDYYPEGEIIKITPTFRVTTSTGKQFNRSKNSCGWIAKGGTFFMVAGHVSRQNLEF